MGSCSNVRFDAMFRGRDSVGRDDLELVAAAKGGSHSAFEELQLRYSSRLYRQIRSITGNHADAEDALQDTFLRAYLALDAFEGRSQFSSWLTRIAINSALMVLRTRRKQAEVPFELASEPGEPAVAFDVPDRALSPEQLCDLRQRAERALGAINNLNIKLRAPMAAWVERECSMNDLARSLDLSLAAVKARIHRARGRLAYFAARDESIANRYAAPESQLKRASLDYRGSEQPGPSYD